MRFKWYIVALSFLVLVGIGVSYESAVGQSDVLLPPGADCFQSDAVISIVLPGAKRPTEVILSGPTVVKRETPQGNTIPTEILMMTLGGSHPEIGVIRVCKRKDQPSHGQITVRNLKRGTADSFFDVFVEIDVTRQNRTFNLHTEHPVRMSVENININNLPPVGKEYKSRLPRIGVPLLLPNGQPSGIILRTVIHRVLRRWENCPPLEGVDCINSEARLEIDYPPLTGTADEVINLTGPALIKRSNPGDNDCDGLAEIDTEMVSLQLTGQSRVLGPIILVNNADSPSLGQVKQKRPEPGFFLADSFFDVFFEVQTAFGTVGQGRTQPRAVVDALPPIDKTYRAPHAADVFDPHTGQLIARILGVKHVPRQQLEWQPTFPPAGVDNFNSQGAFEICPATQQGTPDTEHCFRTVVSGPTRVRRDDPIVDQTTGLAHIPTEIVSMNLTGTLPPGVLGQQGALLRVCAGPQMNVPIRSQGFIQQRRLGFPLPAQSCFDVYFIIYVQIGGQTIALCPDPAGRVTLCSTIYSIPPRTPYCPPGQTAIWVPLYDCNNLTGPPLAFIKIECHLPL